MMHFIWLFKVICTLLDKEFYTIIIIFYSYSYLLFYKSFYMLMVCPTFSCGLLLCKNHSKSQWLKTANICFFLVKLQVSYHWPKPGWSWALRLWAAVLFRPASCVSHLLGAIGFLGSCCTRRMNDRATGGQVETCDALRVIHCGTCMLLRILALLRPMQVTWPNPTSGTWETVLCLL